MRKLFNVPSWVIFKLRIFVLIYTVRYLYRLEGLVFMLQIDAFRRVNDSETCLSLCLIFILHSVKHSMNRTVWVGQNFLADSYCTDTFKMKLGAAYWCRALSNFEKPRCLYNAK